jgi:hypothetical protein
MRDGCWLAIGDPGEAEHIAELREEWNDSSTDSARRTGIADHLFVNHGLVEKDLSGGSGTGT